MKNSKNTLIGVVPVGDIPELASQVVAAHISGYLNLPVQICQPLEHPAYAYDEKRLQYNAAAILKALSAIKFEDYFKVMAILNVDIFIPIFEYLFGEAKVGGKCALVSLFRLSENTDGKSPQPSLVFERAAKVALHELSHLFNLLHCEDARCLMHFTGGIEELDKTPFLFCRYCSKYIRDYWDHS